MHFFDPDRPRFGDGTPMYVSASGQAIAPLHSLNIRPLETADEIESPQVKAEFVNPGDVLYIFAFWCYEGHIATCYSCEVGKYDFASWWGQWLADPEHKMRQVFRNARGESWSWKPHELKQAAPKGRATLQAKADGVAINLDDLFG